MTEDMSEKAVELVRARFRLLCERLKDEHGYGWQTELAALADVDPSLVGKIMRKERNPGLEQLSELIQNLRVSPVFFFDPSLGDEPDYRDFLQSPSERVVVDAAYPALDEFLATPYGASLEPACVTYLRDARFGNGSPTVGMYRAIASEWQDQHRALPKLPAPPVLEVVPSRGKPREKR